MTIRKYIISIAILFGLSWLPLVSSYNYESALCTALTGLIFIPVLAPKNPKQTHKNLAISFLSTCAFWLSANALMILTAWLRNDLCDFFQGLEYQALIAFPGLLLASLTWGWISRFTPRKWLQVLIYILAISIDLGFTLFALYNWPPLVSFGQFYGYFAGSIYDESIDVLQALVKWRIGTAALCLCMLFAQTPNAGITRKILLPIFAILLSFTYHYWLSETQQITPMGRDAIRNALWQTIQTPDYTIHYTPASKNRHKLNEEKYHLAAAYRRDFDYLTDFFQTKPRNHIDIWLYPNHEVKGKFIGAQNTSFARVWKNELHLVESTPDSTLARHEMAHLFAGSFGSAPLMLAGAMHFPAIGWIEGLAMAAEWPLQTYDLHTWSAAILNRNDIFNSQDITPHDLIYGFWSLPSRVAYTLAGSWVRWLIDRYGIEKVKILSQSLPGDFNELIGISFIDAFNQWKDDLNQNHYNSNAIAAVPLAFGASSIWNKQCARASAAKIAEWYRCIDDEFCSLNLVTPQISSCSDNCNNHAPSLQDLEKLYYYYILRGPIDPHPINTLDSLYQNYAFIRPIISSIAHQTRLKSDVESAQYLRSVIISIYNNIDKSTLPFAAQIIWQERIADIMYQANMDIVAAIIYKSILINSLTDTMARRIEIKYRAARAPQHPASQAIKQWFFSDENKIYIAENYKHTPIIAYLDMLNALNDKDYHRAQRAVTRIFMYTPGADQNSKLTLACWKYFIHMIPYI